MVVGDTNILTALIPVLQSSSIVSICLTASQAACRCSIGLVYDLVWECSDLFKLAAIPELAYIVPSSLISL